MAACSGAVVPRGSNALRGMQRANVLKIQDLVQLRAIFMLAGTSQTHQFLAEKVCRIRSKPLVLLTAFLAPSKAIAFGTRLHDGDQPRSTRFSESSGLADPGEMKSGAIAASSVAGSFGCGGFTASSTDSEGDIQWSNAW